MTGQTAPRTYALFSALYPPHLGGVETFTKNLARALAARGASVTVVTNDTEGLGAGIADEDGVEVMRLPCRPLVDGRLPLPRHDAAFRAIDRELRRARWDGVLVNARFYPHSLYGMRMARSHGLTPVVLDHGSAPLSFSNPVLDPLVWTYERAITAWGKTRYQPRYYGISQKSAAWLCAFSIEAEGVITNAIDAAAFRAQSSGRDFRTELGIAPDRPLVAFVGRLIPEKGVASLIEASRDETLRAAGVTFVIAGSGPLEGEVENACSDSLLCVGPLAPADVSALLQQADALCLPTRSEGFSTILLEAAACGAPAIVTDVGGARELIPDERHGTIIGSMAATDIVRAVRRLLDDPALLMEQKARCRERVEGSLSWDETAAAVERALAQAGTGSAKR